MRRFALGVALFLSLAVPLSAKADTIFSLTNATFRSGATITGTITINTISGQFVSADLLYRLDTFSSAFNGTFTDWGQTFDMTQFFGDIYNTNGDLFLIDLPVSWIVKYTGGPICSEANLCNDYFGYFQSASGDVDPSTSGLLVPVTTVPEPSSLMLLATGVSTALGFGRRLRLQRKRV